MDITRHTKLRTVLDKIVTTLINYYHPQKIIVFGSMATDKVSEWSDLDLVIIKETSLPFLQRLKEVALLCQAPVGIDFLVYTPSEFEQMTQEKNPFILEEVIKKGQVIYEQPVETVAN